MAKSVHSRPAARKSRHAGPPTLRQQAKIRIQRCPGDAAAWKVYAQCLLQDNELDDARHAAETALGIAPDDHDTLVTLGRIEIRCDRDAVAQRHFTHAIALHPHAKEALLALSSIQFRKNDNKSALAYVERALAIDPNYTAALARKGQLLSRLFRFQEAAALCEQLIRQDPENAASHWNDLGNIKRELGQLHAAETCYLKAASFASRESIAQSNHLTLAHYMPERSAIDILQLCKKWGAMFKPSRQRPRPRPANISPARPLRVGMFSDGFRQHPVGAMTTVALEHLVKLGIELHAYATSTAVDHITRRVMKVAARWTLIANLDDDAFAQRIRDDEIDILIDMAGHNAGTRMRTMALEPAPILVKWVGGLINTTGVTAIDYLLTDSVESPPDSDALYTEKLVRLPDDYICYLPPPRIPDVGPLPARKNHYVTFGCFNNPTKINDVTLTQWARLLNAVPHSRLFLKGGSFGSAELCQHVLATLQREGIPSDRVRLEGYSPHYHLFECYNEVDIALDPWPYSGGLTTCEAMLMGVPVVTLPGPTFAGRHSATHLTHAGMPELIAADWDQYVARAMELANSLETLSTIRTHLRTVLLASPVCDGPRFARHLANALRAIWQRYCEGKPPAALTFTPEDEPWFEDDEAPIVLSHPERETRDETDAWNFTFQGKIVTIDHGGAFVDNARFLALSQLRSLFTIVVDPARDLKTADQLKTDGHLQHYQSHIALGDGEPTVLHACMDASCSGTLEPLPADQQSPLTREAATVLTTLPISTIRLDDIHGLATVDWLILDDKHDNLKVLQGAKRLLPTMLSIQVKTLFTKTFRYQPDFSSISALLAEHGFRLLRLDGERYQSYFPATVSTETHSGSQLISANAIFIPDAAGMHCLDTNQRLKLAFILHTAYGAPDAAYKVLTTVDHAASQRYLAAGGWNKSIRSTTNSPPPTQYISAI